MKFYGNKLKAMREVQGLMQKDVAKKLNASQQVVERWENGKNRPRPAMVVKLTKILGCSISDLTDLPDITSCRPQRRDANKYSDWEINENLRLDKEFASLPLGLKVKVFAMIEKILSNGE